MPFLVRLCCLTALLAASFPALSRDYIVEMIVFERGASAEQREESWRRDANQVRVHNDQLQLLERQARNLSSLRPSSRLKRLEGALQASGNRIVQSARWVQKARVYKNASVFNLGTNGLKAFVRIYKTALIFADISLGLYSNNPDIQDTTSGFPAVTTAGIGVDQNNAGSLNQGTVNQVNAGISSGTRAPEPVFFINEKRRLKFKEIHYFDHPEFGAILGVWPAG